MCPGTLSIYCSSQTGQSTLTISYSTFTSSDLNPFTTYTLSLVGSINVPDFNIFQSVQKSVSVIWVPFNVSAIILGPQNPISTIANVYQINIQNAFAESEITIVWSTSPSISQSYFTNSNNRKQFVIDKNGFQTGVAYNVTVKIYYASNGWSLYNGSYSVLASVPPYGGSVAVSPTSGSAYQTLFNVSVKAWKSSYMPLKY